MAVETLICGHCSRAWDRERVHGRKPEYCPLPECQAARTGNRPEKPAQRHGETTEAVPAGLGPLEGEDRGAALVEAMKPLHRLTRSDRQTQLDSIMEARDYGKGRRK